VGNPLDLETTESRRVGPLSLHLKRSAHIVRTSRRRVEDEKVGYPAAYSLSSKLDGIKPLPLAPVGYGTEQYLGALKFANNDDLLTVLGWTRPGHENDS